MKNAASARAQGNQLFRLNLIWSLGILLALIAVELWGGYQLGSHSFWAKIIKVESLQSISVPQPNVQAYYRKRIATESWTRIKDPLLQSIEALKWTMNQVRKIATNPNSDPVLLLKSVENGEGGLCREMSNIYQNVLAAVGRPSRRIWLYRDIFSRYDTHDETEVWLNGQWVIMSPTFNVSYANSEGRLLSAMDIKKYLLQGKSSEVKPVFYGEVAYPARLEQYNPHFSMLFNNVFVAEKGSGLFAKVPPFCYWFGSKLYYEKLSNESDTHFQFIQHLYFIFAIVVPVIIMIFLLYIGILLIMNGRVSRIG
ncbi:MAG TPA: transglutaminase domain-containing protein [Bacillota bacterium]|nr:transglutaminase domain-containing protein [Bacillota bacterium]